MVWLYWGINDLLIFCVCNQSMTQRLSKLAEYLYSDSYEMAVELHQQALRKTVDESEEVQLLLAKAYFSTQNYANAVEMASRLKNTRNAKVAYEAHFLEFKAAYLQGNTRPEILEALKIKLRQSNPESLARYLREIEETVEVARTKVESVQMGRSQMAWSERREFEELLKTEDDNSVVMEGMPMFLVSQLWYENWQEYTSQGQKFQKQKQHPGPITQFQLVDHIYNVYFDPVSSKDYTNRYILANAGYKLMPKKCWTFLKDRYGGVEVKRFNISFLQKPYEIVTEVNLKRVEVARVDKERPDQLSFVWVQITKKENWEGLKSKLAGLWGQGQIYAYEGKGNKAVTETESFEEIDTLGKRYVFMVGKAQAEKEAPKLQKCNNRKCSGTTDLRNCQCKSVKYCNIDCLKEDWKNHRAKCELEQEHMRRQPVTFKEFNLEEKDYGGRKGVVGLKNLGNTCYMNSGLQCLSNTKEITDYFMKDDFKSHINHSNPLGTKGNLACAYAELIREMWTGTSESVAPVKLKKKIGDFATQFSGYGQQDSQELISYLIDGLQEDLNLIKKKENFEVSDEIRPDEEMSKESEFNFSKRIQSYIRNLMVGQFKSTVICSGCQKVSVCFDPFMLVSLPVPSNNEWTFFFVPNNLEKGALKVIFQYGTTTTLRSIARQFSKGFNQAYYREIRENIREKLVQDKIIFMTLNAQTFSITKVLSADDLINTIQTSQYLLLLQVPNYSSSDELMLCQYEYNGDRISYPRVVKFSRGSTTTSKDAQVFKSVERGLEKGAPKSSYSELVTRQRLSNTTGLSFKVVVVECARKLKLSTYVQAYNQGFSRRLIESQEMPLNLQDCFKAFTKREKLQKENSWYCNKCKQFKQALKQMQVYKTNKIMVLAFKRFNRHSKINMPIKFPVEGFDIGPFLLSNRSKQPVLYDLYGVVNHHGSLYGGHYTAYCQNFLNKRWYEFNDSRVSEINKSEIVSGYAYVLFYRKRDK